MSTLTVQEQVIHFHSEDFVRLRISKFKGNGSSALICMVITLTLMLIWGALVLTDIARMTVPDAEISLLESEQKQVTKPPARTVSLTSLFS